MRHGLGRFAMSTFIATAAACGGNESRITQTVAPGQTATPPTQLSISPSTATVTAGAKLQLSATVQPPSASTSVTWLITGAGCSISACGTVGSSGLFTAPVSVPNPATVTIVATSTLDPTKSATALITISPAPPPPSGTFSLTGGMTVARSGHSATFLPDGRVLIAGGDGPPSNPAGRSAEIYDPATGLFTATGSMNMPRANHSAVLLPIGKVLIVGPDVSLGAELYDPSTGRFQVTGAMLAQPAVWTAALLANGKVLVAGTTGAQLYDPGSETFQPTGAYAVPPAEILPTAVALPDGRALLVGTDPPQLYDPARNAFSPTASLSATGVFGEDLYSATLLTSGKVLIAGGMDGGRTNAAALYDPTTGSFAVTGSMSAARDAHAAVLLPDGRVLVVGGDGWACSGTFCQFSGSVALAELYNPATQRFESAGNTKVARTEPRATLLKNGDVLITGGWLYCGIGCFNGSTATAELYHPQ